MSAANLSAMTYVGGTAGGTETVYIDAFDGKDWGIYASLTAGTWLI